MLGLSERIAAGPELTGQDRGDRRQIPSRRRPVSEAKVLLDAHRLALAEEKKDDAADSGTGYLTETGGRLALRLQHAQRRYAGGASMKIRRKIIEIDEGTLLGLRRNARLPAPEGAIRIIDGKARLIAETYCDGLGACLGECPKERLP